MKKLALKLDELRVDSFGTEAPEEKGRGTVHGHSLGGTCYYTCYTCQASCGGSCQVSCAGSCWDSCQGGCGNTSYSCAATCHYTCGCSNYTCAC
jgi:hypothetical protein